ncbi:MAG TPA: amidohydrolase, partial [Mycobacteriales bacterium]|nr:amidohydrolase [Mycobacteriales bacterium]
GAGYDPSILPGGVGDGRLLDAVVADRPVLLWATDHHSAWANRAALDVAGVSAASGDPAGGRFVRDTDGQPTGGLLESAAHQVAAHIPPATGESLEAGLRAALGRLVAEGIVWAQEAALSPANVEVFASLAARNELPCRINIAVKADPLRWRDQLAEFDAVRRQHSDLAALSVRTVKFFADGIIESGTASLLEPYSDDHTSCGIALWPQEELLEAAVAVDRLGFQLHIHAIGDGAVRAALDAVEHVASVNGPRDRRPVIAHVQLVHPADLPRFAALGVIANFEPLWAQQDALMTDLTEPRLGDARSSRQYAIATMMRSGAPVSFGSDWPVSSPRPVEGLAVAVTRRTAEGLPTGGWLPAERITLAEATSAYTRGVAYQAYEESECGMMAVGQRADFCLLSADPRAVDPGDLADVSVLRTWSAGREVYST